MIRYLTCVRILGGVMEILLLSQAFSSSVSKMRLEYKYTHL